MRPLSLRNRLVLGAVALLALGLLVADVAGLILFKVFQIQQVDEQLQTPFSTPQTPQLQQWMSRLCDPAQRPAATVQLPTNFAVFTTDANGTTACVLPGGGPTQPTLAGTSPRVLADAAADATILTIHSVQGFVPEWRARVIPIDSGYAVLAISLEDVDAAAARLARISISVGGIILAIASVAGVAVVRIGLKPLTRIERTAQQIADGDLTRRIDVGSTRTEVGRLATSLNAMLAQIESAFADRDRTEEKLRRFVADASHELRTPLATIRGHAELLRSGIASAEDAGRIAGRIESESIRMSLLVDDLLLLARLDTTRVLEQRPIDLLSIAVDAVSDARVRNPERRITLHNPTEPPWQDAPPVVLGDDARLGQVLNNLIANAVQYTPQGSPIEVEVGLVDGRARLSVIDHGPGLQHGNEEKVFERFFREDPGRGRTKGGSGLGLSIAATLVARHGGTLDYRPTEGGGSTFRITVPAAEA
ncbi:sensor histidine kinase [Propionicimonas sp.]|uniref:sensor histidine kinase n=1 Tax=Propionicimonas sp. TaxID=1955623 RepID=UPI0039E505DC